MESLLEGCLLCFPYQTKGVKRGMNGYLMLWNTQESSQRDPGISASEGNLSFHSITKHPRELNLDSHMLVQFCSLFKFHVPLFKSHALLCTIMTKKGKYNYIQGLH